MNWLANIEGIVILGLAIIGAAVQLNIRITQTHERIRAMELREDKCEEDRRRLWAEKADKETTAEIKADMLRIITDFKNDLNHRLDAIMQMLAEMQKKMN